MARIGIDARKYFDFGIGTYIQQLVREFETAAPTHTFVLFVSPEDTGRVQTPPGMDKVESNIAKYSAGEFLSYGRQARKKNIELFHEPHYTLPAGLNGRSVVTIHDLIHLKFPQYFNTAQRAYAAFMMRYAVRNAGAVIAVSHRTKEDIIARFGISEEKIHVIYNGIGKRFRKITDSDALAQFKQRYGVTTPFVLYVGGLKPHKNVGILLRAFARIQKSKKELRLVFAGERLFEHSSLAQQAHSLGIASAIQDVGKLQVEDLAYLYTLADALVLPSLYEGFGFPALEAMACGTPAIVSDRGSLPEVVGDGALIFEAEKTESLVEQLKKVLDNSSARDGLVERGLTQAAKFSWAETAQKTLKLYESLL